MVGLWWLYEKSSGGYHTHVFGGCFVNHVAFCKYSDNCCVFVNVNMCSSDPVDLFFVVDSLRGCVR